MMMMSYSSSIPPVAMKSSNLRCGLYLGGRKRKYESRGVIDEIKLIRCICETVIELGRGNGKVVMDQGDG